MNLLHNTNSKNILEARCTHVIPQLKFRECADILLQSKRKRKATSVWYGCFWCSIITHSHERPKLTLQNGRVVTFPRYRADNRKFWWNTWRTHAILKNDICRLVKLNIGNKSFEQYITGIYGYRMQCCKDGVISAILTAISHHAQLNANVVSKSCFFLVKCSS